MFDYSNWGQRTRNDELYESFQRYMELSDTPNVGIAGEQELQKMRAAFAKSLLPEKVKFCGWLAARHPEYERAYRSMFLFVKS